MDLELMTVYCFFPGQQFRQPSALHFRIQYTQWPSASITDPNPLPPSYFILPTCVSHTSLRRWGWGWAGKPRDHKAEQNHMGDRRGSRRWEAGRVRPPLIPTSTLPLRAFPDLAGGRPQPRPLWSHGNVNLWGGCGLQPGTLKHHQHGPPTLANRLAGPQWTLSKASGADGLSCRLRPS